MSDFDGTLTPIPNNSNEELKELILETKGIKDILSTMKMVPVSAMKEIDDTLSVLTEDEDAPVSPSKRDVAKVNDPGALLIVNTLEDLFGGKNKKDEMDSDLDFGGLGSIGSILSTALPIAGIVASLGLMIWDGIKGLKLADVWGAGKIESAMGGFLGGTESGWKGAFSNLGKYALMGVSIGFLAGGPIGAVAGGLIGAAIGAVLGFIGGETIAKSFTNFKNSIVSIWANEETNILTKLSGTMLNLVNGYKDALFKLASTPFEMIASLFMEEEDAKSFGSKVKDFLKTYSPAGIILNYFSVYYEGFQDIIAKDSSIKKRILGVMKLLFAMPIALFNTIKSAVTSSTVSSLVGTIISSVGSVISNAMSFIGDIGGTLQPYVQSFVQGVFGVIRSGLNVVTGLGEILFENTVNVVSFVFDKIGNIFNTAVNIKDQVVDIIQEKIVTPLIDTFTGIGDFFAYLGSFDSIFDLAAVVKEGGFGASFAQFRSEQQSMREDNSANDRANSYSSAVPYRVNDAIIRPNGDVIETSQDDTLIATKNPVSSVNTGGSGISDRVGREILQALNTLISVTQQNRPESNELNNLRNMVVN